MKLRRFKGSNLFALGKIDLDLENRGLVLVTGHSYDEGGGNGAGKSSLANKGILWTIFGETAGGLRADAVRNRHNKKKCRGEINFIGIDNQKYKIIRERPAKLSLFKGDEEITTTKASETQLLINSLLDIDFKTFIQTSYFGQGRKLSYASLTPKEQKAILEQILPMEEIDRWAVYADCKVKEVTKLSDSAERAHFEAETKVSAQKTLIDVAMSALHRFEEEKKSKVAAAKLQLQEHKTSVDGRAAQLEALQKQIDTANIEEVDQKIQIVQAALNAATGDEYKEVCANHDKAIDSTGQWKARLSSLRHDLNTLETSTSCPTCLRDFDEQTVKGVQQRIAQQKALITEAKTNWELADGAKQYHHVELTTLRQAAQEKQLELQALQRERSGALEYQHQADKLEQSLHSEQIALEIILLNAEKEENPHTEQIKIIENKINEAEKIEVEAHEAMTNLKRELEHLVYWRDVYSKELKLKLFEDACPFLDARTAFHLERLKNRQLHAKFTTIKRLASGNVKEEFNVEVISDTGGSGFDALSGGEQQMVSFAIGLALSDLSSRSASGRSSFVILDEPFSELDARNSEAIVEYLVEEMCKDKETIFLISNEESLKGLVSNRVHVVKKQGVSNVER